MVELQKLLEQMPLFNNPHFSIEGGGFVKYTPWGMVKLLMEQSARFGSYKPNCHVLETLDEFEVHLFDRVRQSLGPDISEREDSVVSIESSYFDGEGETLPYREIVIKLKRLEDS